MLGQSPFEPMSAPRGSEEKQARRTSTTTTTTTSTDTKEEGSIRNTPRSFGELSQQVCGLIDNNNNNNDNQNSLDVDDASRSYVHDILGRFERQIARDTQLNAQHNTPSRAISSILTLCAAEVQTQLPKHIVQQLIDNVLLPQLSDAWKTIFPMDLANNPLRIRGGGDPILQPMLLANIYSSRLTIMQIAMQRVPLSKRPIFYVTADGTREQDRADFLQRICWELTLSKDSIRVISTCERGVDNQEPINLNASERSMRTASIDETALEQAIKQDLQAGRVPCAVLCTLGLDSLALHRRFQVDNLRAVRQVCDTYDLWLHVDSESVLPVFSRLREQASSVQTTTTVPSSSSLLSEASRRQLASMMKCDKNANFQDVFDLASSLTFKPLSWFNLPGSLSLLLLRSAALQASGGGHTPKSPAQHIVAPPAFAFEPCHVIELLPLWYQLSARRMRDSEAASRTGIVANNMRALREEIQGQVRSNQQQQQEQERDAQTASTPRASRQQASELTVSTFTSPGGSERALQTVSPTDNSVEALTQADALWSVEGVMREQISQMLWLYDCVTDTTASTEQDSLAGMKDDSKLRVYREYVVDTAPAERQYLCANNFFFLQIQPRVKVMDVLTQSNLDVNAFNRWLDTRLKYRCRKSKALRLLFEKFLSGVTFCGAMRGFVVRAMPQAHAGTFQEIRMATSKFLSAVDEEIMLLTHIVTLRAQFANEVKKHKQLRCLAPSHGQKGIAVGLGVFRIADADIPERFHNVMTQSLGELLVSVDPHVFRNSIQDGVYSIVVLPHEGYQTHKQIKRLLRIVLQVHSTMRLPDRVEDDLADQIKRGIQRAEERLISGEGKEDNSYFMDYIPVVGSAYRWLFNDPYDQRAEQVSGGHSFDIRDGEVTNAMGRAFVIHEDGAAALDQSQPVTPSHSSSTSTSSDNDAAASELGKKKKKTSTADGGGDDVEARPSQRQTRPPSSSSSKRRSPRAKTPEELLSFITHGSPFISHTLVENSTSESTREFVFVFFSQTHNAVCWTYTTEAVEGDRANPTQWAMLHDTSNSAHRIAMESLTDIWVGKHTTTLKTEQASKVHGAKCVSLIGSTGELHLQAKRTDVVSQWVSGIKEMLKRKGKQFRISRTDVPQSPPPPSSSSSRRPPPPSSDAKQQRNNKRTSSSSRQHVDPTTEPGTAVSKFFNDSGKSTSQILMILTRGQIFTLYETLPGGSVEAKPVFMFYENDVYIDDVCHAHCFFWCNPGERTPVVEQCLALDELTDIYLGKQTRSLQSSAAQRAHQDCCFTLKSKFLSVDLEAPSADQVKVWMQGLRGLLKSTATFTKGKSLKPANSKTGNTRMHRKRPMARAKRSVKADPSTSAQLALGLNREQQSETALARKRVNDNNNATREQRQRFSSSSVEQRQPQQPPQEEQKRKTKPELAVDIPATMRSTGPASATPTPTPSSGIVKPIPSDVLSNQQACSDLLREGLGFTVYTFSKTSIGDAQVYRIRLFFRQLNDPGVSAALEEHPSLVQGGAKGFLCWSMEGNPLQFNASRCIPMEKNVQVCVGKQTKVFQFKAAEQANAECCCSIIVNPMILNIEAPTPSHRTAFLNGFHFLMTFTGKTMLPPISD